MIRVSGTFSQSTHARENRSASLKLSTVLEQAACYQLLFQVWNKLDVNISNKSDNAIKLVTSSC